MDRFDCRSCVYAQVFCRTARFAGAQFSCRCMVKRHAPLRFADTLRFHAELKSESRPRAPKPHVVYSINAQPRTSDFVPSPVSCRARWLDLVATEAKLAALIATASLRCHRLPGVAHPGDFRAASYHRVQRGFRLLWLRVAAAVVCSTRATRCQRAAAGSAGA